MRTVATHRFLQLVVFGQNVIAILYKIVGSRFYGWQSDGHSDKGAKSSDDDSWRRADDGETIGEGKPWSVVSFVKPIFGYVPVVRTLVPGTTSTGTLGFYR